MTRYIVNVDMNCSLDLIFSQKKRPTRKEILEKFRKKLKQKNLDIDIEKDDW